MYVSVLVNMGTYTKASIPQGACTRGGTHFWNTISGT